MSEHLILTVGCFQNFFCSMEMILSHVGVSCLCWNHKFAATEASTLVLSMSPVLSLLTFTCLCSPLLLLTNMWDRGIKLQVLWVAAYVHPADGGGEKVEPHQPALITPFSLLPSGPPLISLEGSEGEKWASINYWTLSSFTRAPLPRSLITFT